ncbi:response regulator, partial [Candidatus Venteria ishoeyi]
MKKIFSTWLQAICSPCFRHLHTFYVRFRAGTRQIPAASGDLPHPRDWPLFARMALMADNNLQRGAADMLPSLPRQRSDLPICHISADNFTVESLQAELNALPEAGGQIYLPPGRLLFEKPLHLPSHLHLIGSPGTELVFRTQEFALVIQGQHEALAQGIHLENLH